MIFRGLDKFLCLSHSTNIIEIIVAVNDRIKIQLVHGIGQPFGFIGSFCSNVCLAGNGMNFWLTECAVEC